MNIKDILHHYMGQKVQIPGAVSWAILNAHNYAYFKDGCVLALRPLDSMTEEEALEFIKAQRPFYHHADLEYCAHDSMGVTYRDGTMTMGIFGEPEGEYTIRFHRSTPVGYHWLLSNGFDIFHLIQRGLAIDSNTLTQ